MSHNYAAKDWHQCRNCGYVRPESELRKLRSHDTVLELESVVYECLDEKCERFKAMRDEMLANERKAEQLAIAGAAIRPRRARR